MVDLRLLEFAVVLDQYRHFGRAADAVGVTQPTFSRGIAALEAALGARLFDRSTRSIEPTPEGAALLARARRLVADAAEFSGAVEDRHGLRSGRVVIGAGPYPLELSVTESVVRLASRFPLLQVEVHEAAWREFGPKLLSGDVDVAVMESSVVELDSRFRVEPLPAHAGCFYCRRGHPLDGRANVTVGAILEFPLVGSRLPTRIVSRLGPPKGAFTCDPATGDLLPRILTTSLTTSRAIVRRTDGIGIAIPSQIAAEVERGELAILDVDAPFLQTRYAVASLRDRSLSRGARAFVATLKEVESELARTAGGSRAGTKPRRRHPKTRAHSTIARAAR